MRRHPISPRPMTNCIAPNPRTRWSTSPIRASLTSPNERRDWCLSNKWMRRRSRDSGKRRPRFPPRNPHIAAGEQRIHVAQAGQARYKTMYQYAVIAAPFTGVVTRRYANKGSLIQAGTSSQTQAMPLVRLSENGKLRLALPVPHESCRSLPCDLGPARCDVQGVSALNRTFPGRVARFADKVGCRDAGL